MNKLFLFFFFLCSVGCEQKITSEFDDVKYYGEDSFIIEGTDITDSLKESRYDRLPISYKKIVRKPVWDLSKNSAGLSIRFLSRYILMGCIQCNKYEFNV